MSLLDILLALMLFIDLVKSSTIRKNTYSYIIGTKKLILQANEISRNWTFENIASDKSTPNKFKNQRDLIWSGSCCFWKYYSIDQGQQMKEIVIPMTDKNKQFHKYEGHHIYISGTTKKYKYV